MFFQNKITDSSWRRKTSFRTYLAIDELDLVQSLSVVNKHVVDAFGDSLVDEAHVDELENKFLPKFIPLLIKKVERFESVL